MEEFDAVVVGAGAAGGWAAKTLTERGLLVCLVDAGGIAVRESPASSRLVAKARGLLAGQHVQARSGAYNAATRRLFVDDRKNPYTTDRDHPFNWFRGRQVGGRLHLWLRVSPRLTAAEMHDWPIGPADLEEDYDEVERFLGVAPARQTPEEERLRAAVEAARQDWTCEPAPVAEPDPGPVPRMVEAAAASGRLTLRTGVVVRRVDANGVSGIDTATGAEVSIRGRAVVLAAGTIDTVRLLLASGLGNSSGLLGRGLSDHILAAIGGSDVPTAERDSAEVGLRVLAGSRPFVTQCAAGRSAWWSIVALGAMEPSPDNRVTLDPRVRDAWGVPAARIRCAFSGTDLALAAEMIATLHEIASIAGLQPRTARSAVESLLLRLARRRLQSRDGLYIPGSAIHETGGAPLGSDAGTSVLDPFGRCWDAPSVLVVDGAAFPSGGWQNVTPTIMALAGRATRQLAAEIAPH